MPWGLCEEKQQAGVSLSQCCWGVTRTRRKPCLVLTDPSETCCHSEQRDGVRVQWTECGRDRKGVRVQHPFRSLGCEGGVGWGTGRAGQAPTFLPQIHQIEKETIRRGTPGALSI